MPTHEQTANPRVGLNYTGLKHLAVIFCDGTDVFDSQRAVQHALEHMRSGALAAGLLVKAADADQEDLIEEWMSRLASRWPSSLLFSEDR